GRLSYTGRLHSRVWLLDGGRRVKELLIMYEPPLTATTTPSLHDALPICGRPPLRLTNPSGWTMAHEQFDLDGALALVTGAGSGRSEEHTSELQSQSNLVCRLLLEKKNRVPSLLSAPNAACKVYYSRSLC